MAITQVQLFSVPVRDQDTAKEFYVGVLGLELRADDPMGPDRRWVQDGPRPGVTSISLVDWFPTMPPGSTKGIVLETDDLDGDAAALRERGVAVSEVEEAPWGRFVTLDDPDGNGIVLQATAGRSP